MQLHSPLVSKQVHHFSPSLLYRSKSLISLCKVKWFQRARLRESSNFFITGVGIGVQDRIGKFRTLQAGMRDYK